GSRRLVYRGLGGGDGCSWRIGISRRFPCAATIDAGWSNSSGAALGGAAAAGHARDDGSEGEAREDASCFRTSEKICAELFTPDDRRVIADSRGVSGAAWLL